MKGDSPSMVVGDWSMGMAETYLSNATLGAMTDLVEVLQQSIRHDAARVDSMRNQAVHLAPHDQAIQIVSPAFAWIMYETISSQPQKFDTHAAIRCVAMQKQRITQPQVEPIPVEVRVLCRQSGKQGDQLGVIIMIPQHKMKLTAGDSLHQFLQPLRCCGEARLE